MPAYYCHVSEPGPLCGCKDNPPDFDTLMRVMASAASLVDIKRKNSTGTIQKISELSHSEEEAKA